MTQKIIAALTLLAASTVPVLAEEGPIKPETLTLMAKIPEGPHAYILDFALSGASQVYVLNGDDLSLQGSIGTGTFAQLLMTADKSQLYTASGYLSRYTYGDLTAVIQEWDPQSLELKREFNVSNKIAQTLSQHGIVNPSADGAYLIVQNATPATSVTIADLKAGSDITEIPTPGCWTAYPTLEGHAFTTLCGDGTIAKYSYSDDGASSAPQKSDKVFDADADPLFGDSTRIGPNLAYISYNGTLYLVDDSGEKPVVKSKTAFAEENWVPGGYNLMAYHAPSQTLFVLMHKNPSDGSHKQPADEIWAINMKDQKVVGRSEAHGETNIALSGGDKPVLYGVDHLGGVHRYDVSLGDKVSVTQTAAREGVAAFPTMIVTDF